jgi:hypothetical protein
VASFNGNLRDELLNLQRLGEARTYNHRRIHSSLNTSSKMQPVLFGTIFEELYYPRILTYVRVCYALQTADEARIMRSLQDLVRHCRGSVRPPVNPVVAGSSRVALLRNGA